MNRSAKGAGQLWESGAEAARSPAFAGPAGPPSAAFSGPGGAGGGGDPAGGACANPAPPETERARRAGQSHA